MLLATVDKIAVSVRVLYFHYLLASFNSPSIQNQILGTRVMHFLREYSTFYFLSIQLCKNDRTAVIIIKTTLSIIKVQY